MSQGEFKASATENKENGVKPFLCFLVGTAVNSDPQLLDRAGFRVGVMTLATDAPSKEVFKKVQVKNSVFYARTFGKRSRT